VNTWVPFETDRLLVRPWKVTDASTVVEASREPAIAEAMGLPSPSSVEDAHRWIESQFVDPERGFRLAVVERSREEAIGHVTLIFADDGRWAIGYWLLPRCRGRGLATEAVASLVDHAFAEAGARRLEARIEPPNEPSERLVAGLGFTREGILRAYEEYGGRRHDMAMWSLLPTDRKKRAGD
jgi:ribosomal-protein-alanine N-acetyltransferase